MVLETAMDKRRGSFRVLVVMVIFLFAFYYVNPLSADVQKCVANSADTSCIDGKSGNGNSVDSLGKEAVITAYHRTYLQAQREPCGNVISQSEVVKASEERMPEVEQLNPGLSEASE